LTLREDTLLFRVPLVAPGEIRSATQPPGDEPEDFEGDMPEDMIDLTIDLDIGMHYRELDPAEAYDASTSPRITFMVSERKCEEPESSLPHAVGFQIRDPREFDEWGPYRGVEANVEELEPTQGVPDFEWVLGKGVRPGYLPDDRGDLGAIEFLRAQGDGRKSPVARNFAQIPERFQITLKPNAWWGRCASAVDGGHTISVAPFFSSIDVSAGLHLDIYARKPGKNYYEIRYIEVRIHS
jgi:hypothetical protein